jgi:hypothetical protein
MARITRAAPHLSAEELKTKLKLDPHPWRWQRWLVLPLSVVDTSVLSPTCLTISLNPAYASLQTSHYLHFKLRGSL